MSINILRIKIINNEDTFLNEKYSEVRDKIFKHDGDVGFDLFQPYTVNLNRSISNKLGTGIACELVRHNVKDCTEEYLPYMIVPRSSISKTPLRLCNSIGIIDAGYRGELLAFVDCHSDSFTVNQGDQLSVTVNSKNNNTIPCSVIFMGTTL